MTGEVMKLLRTLSLATVILTCVAAALAQQPACTLKQAPEYNGFRIGMTMMEVKDRVADPSTFDDKVSSANKIGSLAIEILGQDLKDEYAAGVEDVHLTFVDKRLAVIKVTYNGADNWMGAQDFFKQVSNKLGLTQVASTGSARGSGGNEKYKIECTGFAAILAYSFGVSPNVTIYDTAAQKLVDQRSEQNPDGKVKRIDITPPRTPVNPHPPR
jgi:hypothetical protein